MLWMNEAEAFGEGTLKLSEKAFVRKGWHDNHK